MMRIILYVAVTWIIAEILKTIIESYKAKKFSPRFFLAYGGMPSAHTTFVVALATSIFLVEEMSTAFLVSVGLAIVVVRDLIKVRDQIDKNTSAIAKIQKMKPVLLSHTYLEIFVGLLLGILGPVLLSLFI